MRESLLEYFQGEKSAGLLVAGIGGFSLALAILLAQPRYDLRPFAITLGVLGLGEIALGLGLFFKTGPQVDALLAQLASDAPKLYAAESARMAKVQAMFVRLEIAWTAIIAVCAITALVMKGRPVVNGIALGLLLHVAMLLAFDTIAERRGATYLRALESAN